MEKSSAHTKLCSQRTCYGMDGWTEHIFIITACPEVKKRAMTWQRGLDSKCYASIKVVLEHGVQATLLLLPLLEKLVSVPPAGHISP